MEMELAPIFVIKSWCTLWIFCFQLQAGLVSLILLPDVQRASNDKQVSLLFLLFESKKDRISTKNNAYLTINKQ